MRKKRTLNLTRRHEKLDLSQVPDNERKRIERILEQRESFSLEAAAADIERWRASARTSGKKIREWVIDALNAAASRAR